MVAAKPCSGGRCASSAAYDHAGRVNFGPIVHTTVIVQFCLHNNSYTHARARQFNGPLSGSTRVSRYQKGKTNLDFSEARNSE